jgi:hypothetical protein
MIYVVTRPHVDRNGNHRRWGDRLDLTPELAAIWTPKHSILPLEEFEVLAAERREANKTRPRPPW